MRVVGLVGTDLRRDDRELERDADPLQRRLDEVAIGVGEDGELPAASARILERRPHLRERHPRGKRLREPGYLGLGGPELAHRSRHDLSVAALTPGLERRLDLVVAVEPHVSLVLAEHTRQLTADAAVPVDQGSVTVERRPAVSRHCHAPSLRSA